MAQPAAALAFLFRGSGIVIFPIVLIYTGAVFGIFRGTVGKNLSGYGDLERPCS
jgi:hypothetical protein